MIRIGRLKTFAVALCSALFSVGVFAQNAALVIIDMQSFYAENNGAISRPENQATLERVLERQRTLIRMAKERRMPILVVEYKSCGPSCKAITDEIGNYDKAHTFLKDKPGLFDPRNAVVNEVKGYLADNKVSKLVVAGANGGACAKCSIEGALNAGFEVFTDPGAIVDFNALSFVHPYEYKEGQLQVDPAAERRLNQSLDPANFDRSLGTNCPALWSKPR